MMLSRSAVQDAHEKIRSYIHRTPVLTSTTIDQIASDALYAVNTSCTPKILKSENSPKIEIFFKCENFQKSGSFKARGAFFNVMTLPSGKAAKGVCTHSSGNHAQALALAAKKRGIPAFIVMPGISTSSKIDATKGYGATVQFSGSTSVEREVVLKSVQDSTGATFIPPYDFPGTIVGQGTTGLELEQQVREEATKASRTCDLDAVVAPLGGGGLLSGLAVALSAQVWNGHPALIYGAEPSYEGADDAKQGLANEPPSRIEFVKSLTIADGLRTPVGKLNWNIISDKSKVAGVYSVTEEQIKNALKIILERLKVWVEPSAAVPLAVILYDREFQMEILKKMRDFQRESWRIGVIFSGGNTTTNTILGLYN